MVCLLVTEGSRLRPTVCEPSPGAGRRCFFSPCVCSGCRSVPGVQRCRRVRGCGNVLIVVSAILGITRFPADDRVLRCEVCRQPLAGDEHGGLCSAACAAEYRDVLDRQEEEDHWWRAIA